MTQIDLRKPKAAAPQPFATAPAASASAVLPGHNRMPMPVGVIVPASLTPAEQAMAKELGLDPTKAMPGNLAELLENARATAMAEQQNAPPPAPLSTPPLRLPEAVPFGKLPPAHQADILAAVQDAGKMHQQQQELQQAQASLPPSVVAAVQAGIQAQAEAPRLATTPVVDDRTAPAYADTGEPKPAVMSRPVAPSSVAVPPPNPSYQDVREKLHELYHQAHAMEFDLPYCPHCGWDQSVQDPIVVTDDDKRSFLATFLGGKIWKKEFVELGGMMRIIVRNLTPPEVDLCYRQAWLEQARGEITSQKEYTETVNRYHIGLQICGFFTSAGVAVPLPDHVSNWGVDDSPTDTPLKDIYAYLLKNIFFSETSQRLISDIVVKFNRTLSKLEANVPNSDFWKGIALPG